MVLPEKVGEVVLARFSNPYPIRSHNSHLWFLTQIMTKTCDFSPPFLSPDEKCDTIFMTVAADTVALVFKAGVHMKAVFWLGIMFLKQLSRLRSKQSRISMLISDIYVLGRFVNVWGIFRYIWR